MGKQRERFKKHLTKLGRRVAKISTMVNQICGMAKEKDEAMGEIRMPTQQGLRLSTTQLAKPQKGKSKIKNWHSWQTDQGETMAV